MSEQPATAAPGKYLTFALGDEEYGLPVLKVREIIKMMDVTSVPQMPAHVRGVINLRGKVIPVIDLRLKFGLDGLDATDHTCIIVVQVELNGRRVMLGIIVDRVSEVLNVSTEEIEAPPDFGERLDTQFMQGLAKVKGRVKILLELDQVLGADAAVCRAA